MAKPCYSGPNPIKDEERLVIWKWAKENGGVDDGFPIHSVANAINTKFFGGMAKPEWIEDIISGNKTPFREVTNEMWKKQYNRRVAINQAKELSQLHNLGPVGKTLRTLWTLPRSVAVFGHGVVFPITHGGDLAFRPESWGDFIKGTFKTYRGAFDKGYTARVLDMQSGDPLYDLGIRSGVDMGPSSHPSGLISRSYHGPAQRAWDMLTVMRFELWKSQMNKWTTPEMSSAEVLEHGKEFADWANKATGSGKGPIAKLGGELLFGPKLTESKIQRTITDPIKTVKTFANWEKATNAEKAVAWTRLSGAAQYLGTMTGLLAVNQGLMYALGQKDKVNFSDPTKGDFLSFKGGGILGSVPGLHTEIRTLARILSAAFLSRKERRGESRFSTTAKIVGQYGMGKLTPTIQRGLEVGFQEDWLGRPLPWSSDPGTPNKPRLTYGEYAGAIGPIPLEGPISFVYDHLRRTGMSGLDATTLVKALIIGGFGAPGFHVREDYAKEIENKPTPLPRR